LLDDQVIREKDKVLNVINLDILAGATRCALFFRVAVLIELEAAVAILAGAEGVGLVDLGCIWEFAVRFAKGKC